jgi:hypothetical protein
MDIPVIGFSKLLRWVSYQIYIPWLMTSSTAT